MIVQEKINKMLAIYSKLNGGKLIKTLAVNSPSPVVEETYKTVSGITWNNPSNGNIKANSCQFDKIATGSEPNCIIFKNEGWVWSETSNPQATKKYFESIYDIIMSNVDTGAEARIGKKIGSTVYDYVLYEIPIEVYETSTQKQVHTVGGQYQNIEDVYALIGTDPQYENAPVYIAHKLDDGYGVKYYMQKKHNAEGPQGNTVIFYPSQEKIYSIAFDLDDHKNEPLIFTAESSITIPTTTIELKEEV